MIGSARGPGESFRLVLLCFDCHELACSLSRNRYSDPRRTNRRAKFEGDIGAFLGHIVDKQNGKDYRLISTSI